MKRFIKTVISASIAAIGIGVAASASALTFDLTYNGFALGSAESAAIASTSPAVNYSSVAAGAFSFTAAATGVANQSFLAYCIEITQSLVNFGTDYTTTTPAGYGWSNARQTDIAKLFNVGYLSSLTSTVKSAGFQLALWEMVYDSGTYNLASGNFTGSSGNAGVITHANAYLAAAAAGTTGHGQFTVWQSPTAQNYLQFQVPEPGSLALIAGLGMVGFALRTRATRLETRRS